MHSIWTKVRTDLLIHPARTGLAVVSMAIGIFVVGTLLGMMDLELTQMDSAHQHSSPSHINLLLKTDTELSRLNAIKALPGVLNVDTQTQFTVRYQTPNHPEWQLGTLVFRDDYAQQRYDKLSLAVGPWPKDNTVAGERLSTQFADLQRGDDIVFESPAGPFKTVLDGIIRHPFVKPPAFGGQLHFFIDPALAPIFGIPRHTFRQLLVQVTPPYSEEKARQVAARIRAHLAAQEIRVNATLLQNPRQHWGRPFFAGINLVLTLMAWASLGLSAVLILNTVAALIAQQTDQIGMLKSIGTRRGTIALIYFSEVVILSLAALAIALPASLAAAYWSSRWLLDLFNIDLPGFVYSRNALLCMLVGGLLAPLFAAAWPIWRGASMSVREALASYGLGTDFSSNRVTAWLEHKLTSVLPTLYAVALANVVRRKARLFWTQSVLVIAGVLFMVIMSLIESVNLTLDQELARSRYAVRLGFSVDQPEAVIKSVATALPQTTGLELWQRMPIELTRKGALLRQTGSLGIQLLALPVNTTMYEPLIVAGRWFTPTDAQQNRLVLNAETAALNGIQIGDAVQVDLAWYGRSTWEVIGLYRWFAGSGYTVEPVYAPLSTLQTVTQRTQTGSFALLSATVSTLTEEKHYADALKQGFQAQHIALDFYTTVARLEQRQFAQQQFRPITTMLLGLAGLIAAVGGIGLSGTLAMGVLQRTREIGVLRAIGASRRVVFTLFILEGLLHGLLAWLLSIPLAYAIAEPLAHRLGDVMLGLHLTFRFSIVAVSLWFMLIMVLAYIAAYWPARAATRVVVRESLNY